MKPTHTIRSILAAVAFSFSCQTMATPVTSMVVLGDSLSDNGNTTHLLKALRQEESPAYLVHPVKAFVINKMTEYANYYYIPQMVLDAGIQVVTNYLDYDVAPYLAELVGRIRDVPILPGKPYWHDHFTNGEVWNEYLAEMFQIDAYDEEVYLNRAFAGSWALTYDYQLTTWNLIRHPVASLKNLVVGKLIPPSLGLITQAHLLENDTLDNDAVYFIFAGANDYISMLNFEDNYDVSIRSTYIDNVLDAIESSTTHLIAQGASHFVIMGLPDVSLSPRFTTTADKVILKDTVDEHNKRLEARLVQWQAAHPDVDYMYVDISSSLKTILAEPAEHGLTNTKDACIDVKLPKFKALARSPFPHNSVLQYAQVVQYVSPKWAAGAKNYHECKAPNEYLFWDEIHPSTKVHKLLAKDVCDAMKAHGYEVECR